MSANHGFNVAKHVKRLDNRLTAWQDNTHGQGRAVLIYRFVVAKSSQAC